MNNGKQQDDAIVRYILGEMSDEEQAAIEERYFDDGEFLKRVQSVRDDLVDAYVRGTLSAPLRRRLEQRMDENPALRSKVDFAATLQQALECGGSTPLSYPLESFTSSKNPIQGGD